MIFELLLIVTPLDGSPGLTSTKSYNTLEACEAEGRRVEDYIRSTMGVEAKIERTCTQKEGDVIPVETASFPIKKFGSWVSGKSASQCAMSQYAGENFISFSYDRNELIVTFTLPKTSGLQNGQSSGIFEIDGSKFDVSANKTFGSQWVVRFKDGLFLQSKLAHGIILRFSARGRQLASISLAKSADALDRLNACHDTE